MKDVAKDFVKRRRAVKEKEEKLFIDSVIECDFADEETVNELFNLCSNFIIIIIMHYI